MEFIIIPLIAAALLLILGVSGMALLELLYILMLLILFLMTVFFLSCAVFTLTCKRREAELARFEKHNKFDTAVYLCDEEEYYNIFPAENIMRERIYSKEPQKVLIKRGKRSLAVDRHSLFIIIFGLILSPISLAVIAAFARSIF